MSSQDRASPSAVRGLARLAVFAVAFAYIESAVVVYLRLVYYPEGFAFPLRLIEPWVGAIEVGREAATLVMLAAVAWISGRDRWERFLHFCFTFGVWDILYYVFLWVFLRWPPSLLTWDILFLIPVPWVAPVLAPVAVSVLLIAGSLLMLRLRAGGMRFAFAAWHWALAVSGGAVVLASFMIDASAVLAGEMPPPFRWWLFGAGLAAGAAATAFGIQSALAKSRDTGPSVADRS
jgi:hypothetical protein